MAKRDMLCACCDGRVGMFEQHWNRDKGYGICRPCVEREAKTSTRDEIESRYGIESVNYPAGKPVLHYCTCCNEQVGRYAQWRNLEPGVGICGLCIERFISPRMTKAEIYNDYGVAGVHYPAAQPLA